MLLALDIGNTHLVAGLFDEENLLESFRVAHPKSEFETSLIPELKSKLDTLNSKHEFKRAIISSVAPSSTKLICETLENDFYLSNIHVLSYESDFHLDIQVTEPSKVGLDRLVDCAAFHHIYQSNGIVVDLGTATTIDVVIDPGCFLGGVIIPGPKISSEALVQNTAQLMKVPLEKPKHVVGRNTTEAIQSGLYFGYLGMIESFIQRIKIEHKQDFKVCFTGGLSEVFRSDFQHIGVIEPHLTLTGLRLLAEWN